MLILGVFVFEEAGVAHSGAIGDHYSVSTQQTRCRRHITVALLWLDWTFAVAAAGSSAPRAAVGRRWGRRARVAHRSSVPLEQHETRNLAPKRDRGGG